MSVPAGVWVDKVHEAQAWSQRFLQTYRRNNGLGIDTETTGLDKLRDRVVVWSLSDGVDRICMPADFIRVLREPVLEHPLIPLNGTSLKFDAHMIANSGADISKAGEWRDTLVQSFLLNENNIGGHGLKESTKTHLHRETPHFKDVFGTPVSQLRNKKGIVTRAAVTVGDLVRKRFTVPPPPNFTGLTDGEAAALQEQYAAALDEFEQACDYASLDAYNSNELVHVFDEKLDAIAIGPGYTLKNYFYSVEVPFTKVLWKMERRGITVDRGHLEAQRGPMEREMSNIVRSFGEIFTDEIGHKSEPNLDSPYDVRKLFFEVKHKEPIKFTKGGESGNKQPSVDAEVLETWAGQGDEWAEAILRYRSISKIHGTYIKGLEEWIDPNYRIHTSLNQIGTVTGRLSSSEPNLQNIPRPGEDSYKIREAFTHGELMRLLVGDYEQGEMRLTAHFSEDQKMIDAIRNGVDLHCLTVAEVYGIPYDDVQKAKKAEKAVKEGKRKEPLTAREEELLFYRQAAKVTGFGIIYGIGGPHLAANLTRDLKKLVTPQEGCDLIKKWLAVFPGVSDYIDRKKRDIRNYGFVQTLMGRFRRFGDLNRMTRMDAAREERMGVNSIIQGSLSDWTKKAMLLISEDSVLKENNAFMLLQVHDELILECPDDPEVVKTVKGRVKELMEHPFDQELLVPMPVSIGDGETWADAK